MILMETKEEQLLNKLIQNRKDPINWIKENVKISHPAHGLLPFELYDFQEKIIKLFLAQHFVITLKSRQVGLSTLTQAICLWSAMHYANFNILILSTGQRNAASFLSKIRKMYEFLPNNELKLPLDTDNKQSLVFANGSKIVAVPATRSSSLGESINLLIIDEAAFIDRVEDVYQAAYPTLSRAFKSNKGKPYGIIVISTPNGISGTGKWYYEMYEGAIYNVNKYIPIKIHWTQVPEYDEDWYLDQCAQLNWNYRQIAAELELSFVSSGNTYIPGQILDSIGVIDPIHKTMDDKLWVWENPVQREVYIAGVDVAYGDRKDSSVMQILNARTLEQVAEFESNTIKPDEFASVIINLSKTYNNCLVNIERNAVGKVLIDKVLDKTSGFMINLYRDVSKNELNLSYGESPSFKSNIGTLVTGQSRDVILANMYNILLDKYTEALDTMLSEDDEKASAKQKFQAIMSNKKTNPVKKVGIIKSERLLHQMLGFVVDEHGRAEGIKDDLVFGWSHALYAWVKSKAMLLKDVASIFNIKDNKASEVEVLRFMKENNPRSTVWNNFDINSYIDEIEAESFLETEKVNNENKSSITNIYKAFYGG